MTKRNVFTLLVADFEKPHPTVAAPIGDASGGELARLRLPASPRP